MTLNVKPRSGPFQEVRYSPQRDIAYLYGPCVQAAEDMVYEGRDESLTAWLDANGITHDELGEAFQKFCLALNAAHQNPKESWEDVLERTGFSKVKAPARIAMMYYIGTIMAGTFFQGIRDVVELGDDTVHSIQNLIETGEDMARYLAKGRISRWWYRIRRRLWPKRRTYTIRG